MNIVISSPSPLLGSDKFAIYHSLPFKFIVSYKMLFGLLGRKCSQSFLFSLLKEEQDTTCAGTRQLY